MRILSTTQMVFCQREIRRMSKIWSGSLVTKKGYRTKNLKWPMDIGEMSLPIEIWAFVLTYLLSLDLFYLSICSKSFYSIVHQNKKFKRRFGHSKKLKCGVQFYYQLMYEFEKVFYQAYNCFARFFNWWHLSLSEEKVASNCYFQDSTFSCLQQLFSWGTGISRQFSSCDICCKVVTIDIQISNIINSRLMFDRSLFPNGFSEAFLVDYIFCLSNTIKVWKANALMSFLVLILAFIKSLFVTHFFCTRDTWKF